MEWISINDDLGLIGHGVEAYYATKSAQQLGYKVWVLNPYEEDMASQLADYYYFSEYDDLQAIRAFAEEVACVIYTTSEISSSVIEELDKTYDVPQGFEILSTTQDLLIQKYFLESLGIDQASFVTVVNKDEIYEAAEHLGYPCILKRPWATHSHEESYIFRTKEDVDELPDEVIQGSFVVEEYLQARQTLTISIGKDEKGQVIPVSLAETVYKEGKLYQSFNPPSVDNEIALEAFEIAHTIAAKFGFIGLISVDFVYTVEGDLVVSKLSPYPTSPAIYTLEADNLSQYDVFIRTVVGWPVPQIEHYYGVVMVQFYSEHREKVYREALKHPHWLLYSYHREDEPDQVQGHLLVVTSNVDQALEELESIDLWDLNK